MANSQHVQQITLWLTKLALLTSGGRTPVTKQQIGLYALSFADEMPISVFTDESLSAISDAHEFFPAKGVLKRELQGWVTEVSVSNPTGRRISKLTGVP